MEGILRPVASSQGGSKVITHDFQNPDDLQLLSAMAEEVGLPKEFNSFMFTFVRRGQAELVFLGHPPMDLIQQALRLPELPARLLIDQEEMHDAPKTYDLWPFEGEVKQYSIKVPLEEALRQANVLKSEPVRTPSQGSSALLPTVLLSGLADGINPCAFAVMAFFTALLFALRRSRQQILAMGAAYIVGMYFTYFLLGLGLLRALDLFGQPHLITQAGGVIAIALGLIQIKDGLLPGLPLHLTVPKPGWEMIQSLARRTGLPMAFVLGGLVGLCTLPCSGGIYVAILGLLSSQVSYATGLGYLLLYNVMFVLPLLGILLVISSRPMSLALAGWERRNSLSTHAIVGAVMVALGVLILGWLH